MIRVKVGQVTYLNTHVKTVHKGQKDFKCDECGKAHRWSTQEARVHSPPGAEGLQVRHVWQRLGTRTLKTHIAAYMGLAEQSKSGGTRESTPNADALTRTIYVTDCNVACGARLSHWVPPNALAPWN